MIQDTILQTLTQSTAVQSRFINSHLHAIEQAVVLITDTLKKGGKILTFGNGGSAADAQHIAAEFVNRFQLERPPLPALALTTDSSVITSIGNDYQFEDIFSKQIQALGNHGDLALAISTSGNSPNVVKATKTALEKGLSVIGFSGSSGSLNALSTIAFAVPSTTTARIQEAHILLAHILCDLTEKMLYLPAQG